MMRGKQFYFNSFQPTSNIKQRIDSQQVNTLLITINKHIDIRMDTESIVRRIIQLKKVSVELKQTTEDPMSLKSSKTDFIQSILRFSKSISYSADAAKPEKLQPTTKSEQVGSSKQQGANNLLFKLLENSNSKNEGQALRSDRDYSQSGFESSVFTGRTKQDLLTVPQQINYLKQDNSDIEQDIKELREKLKRLQEIERQEREEDWKDGLPFFTLTMPKLKIFYTKLLVNEKDYGKIDYSLYSANLSIDRAVFTQLPQAGLLSRPPKCITVMVADLKEVSYYPKKVIAEKNPLLGFGIGQKGKEVESENLIVYQFKLQKWVSSKPKSKSGKKSAFARLKSEDKTKEEEETSEGVETLFIKFETEQQMKQWDLGMFVNYKIMEETAKADHKAESSNSMNSSTVTYEDPKKETEKPNVQFKDLIELAKKSTSREAKQIQHLRIGSGSIEPLEKKQSYQYKNFVEEVSPPKADNNMIKIRDEVDSPLPTQKQKQEPVEEDNNAKHQRSNTSHFGGANDGLTAEEKAKQLESEKLKAEEQRRQKQMEIEENKRKEAERMQAMKKMEQELALKKARENLQKGYLMTKYAKSAFHPYEKKVFLSDDGNNLCWTDISSPGDPKHIEIAQIGSISQGKIGVGVEAHMNAKKIQKKGCFVVITLNSKDRKTLEFSSRDEAAMDEFCKDLELYRKSDR